MLFCFLKVDYRINTSSKKYAQQDIQKPIQLCRGGGVEGRRSVIMAPNHKAAFGSMYDLKMWTIGIDKTEIHTHTYIYLSQRVFFKLNK